MMPAAVSSETIQIFEQRPGLCAKRRSFVSRQARDERLERRRTERAGVAATDKAVFDHFKIGDGRGIGNVRLGELRRLADRARMRRHQ